MKKCGRHGMSSCWVGDREHDICLWEKGRDVLPRQVPVAPESEMYRESASEDRYE